MAQKRSTLLRSAALLLFIGPGLMANAQDWKSEKKVNVLFGISQVLASGFNIEVNYISNRFIFDYSHGVALHFSGNTVTPELKREGVAVLMPWTTGFGIGYRITDWINIRMEPKWHRFEFYYKGDPQTSNNQLSSYNTFSLGLGLYGSWQPFKHKTNFLKGFMISPSIRFWPTVGSTRKDGFTYFNKNTAKYESIPKLDPGLGFTPLVANISVGYSFSL
jgi:hypothetical protein